MQSSSSQRVGNEPSTKEMQLEIMRLYGSAFNACGSALNAYGQHMQTKRVQLGDSGRSDTVLDKIAALEDQVMPLKDCILEENEQAKATLRYVTEHCVNVEKLISDQVHKTTSLIDVRHDALMKAVTALTTKVDHMASIDSHHEALMTAVTALMSKMDRHIDAGEKTTLSDGASSSKPISDDGGAVNASSPGEYVSYVAIADAATRAVEYLRHEKVANPVQADKLSMLETFISTMGSTARDYAEQVEGDKADSQVRKESTPPDVLSNPSASIPHSTIATRCLIHREYALPGGVEARREWCFDTPQGKRDVTSSVNDSSGLAVVMPWKQIIPDMYPWESAYQHYIRFNKLSTIFNGGGQVNGIIYGIRGTKVDGTNKGIIHFPPGTVPLEYCPPKFIQEYAECVIMAYNNNKATTATINIGYDGSISIFPIDGSGGSWIGNCGVASYCNFSYLI